MRLTINAKKIKKINGLMDCIFPNDFEIKALNNVYRFYIEYISGHLIRYSILIPLIFYHHLHNNIHLSGTASNSNYLIFYKKVQKYFFLFRSFKISAIKIFICIYCIECSKRMLL